VATNQGRFLVVVKKIKEKWRQTTTFVDLHHKLERLLHSHVAQVMLRPHCDMS